MLKDETNDQHNPTQDRSNFVNYPDMFSRVNHKIWIKVCMLDILFSNRLQFGIVFIESLSTRLLCVIFLHVDLGFECYLENK